MKSMLLVLVLLVLVLRCGVLALSTTTQEVVQASNVIGEQNFTTEQPGQELNEFLYPYDVFVDETTQNIFVSETKNQRILRFNSSAAFMNGAIANLLVFGQSGVKGCSISLVQNAQQITTLKDSLFIADSSNNRIIKIEGINTANTTIEEASTVFGQEQFTVCVSGTSMSNLWEPSGVVFDSKGNLWVADTENNMVKRFNNALKLGNFPEPSAYLGTGVSVTSQNSFFWPRWLGIDPDNGNLFVSDYYRVLLFLSAQNKPNEADADVVFGQSTFSSKAPDCTNSLLNIDPGEPFYDTTTDTLVVSDGYNQRVVFWSNATSAMNGEVMSYVIGQDSLDFCPLQSSPNSSNFGNSRGLHYAHEPDHVGLLVVDISFNRILRFEIDL